MITLRRSEERGRANHGWLDTAHTFSFSSYYDPAHMGFRALRVINEDKVAAGAGFPTHPHRDMEIITYVLDGALEHKDSMGTGSVIRPGDVQRMSAGSGVTHSEYNHSKRDGVHFLQIWILPEKAGIAPSYEQKSFPAEEKGGRLRVVASSDGREGSVTVHQDMALYATVLGPGQEVTHALKPGRHAWVQAVRGSINVNGQTLQQGDGAAISEEGSISLTAPGGTAEALLFDLS